MKYKIPKITPCIVLDIDTEYNTDFNNKQGYARQLISYQIKSIHNPDKNISFKDQNTLEKWFPKYDVEVPPQVYRSQNVETNAFNYPYHKEPIADYLTKILGFDNVEIRYELPSKNEAVVNLPITLSAHFSIVDVFTTFSATPRANLEAAVISHAMVQHKIPTPGKQNIKYFPTGLYIYNVDQSINYHVVIDIQDTAQLTGSVSLSALMDIVGVDTTVKHSLDAIKTNMRGAYLDTPEAFHTYALGDLCTYELKQEFDHMWVENINNLVTNVVGDNAFDIGVLFKSHAYDNRLKYLTFGKRIMDTIEQYIRYELSNRGKKRNEPMEFDQVVSKGVDITQLIYDAASPTNLLQQPSETISTLAKTHGGRAFNSYPGEIHKIGDIVEVDLTGAYNRAQQNLDMPVGYPVKLSMPKRALNSSHLSLGKVLRLMGYDPLKPLTHEFVLSVNNPHPNFTNVYIPSFKPISSKESIKIKDVYQHYATISIDDPAIVYTHEITNGIITHETYCLLRGALPSGVFDNFLEDTLVTAGLFYPSSHYLKDVDEVTLMTKIANSDGFTAMELSVENGQYIRGYKDTNAPYWTHVKTGEFNKTIQEERSKHPKGTSLNTFYKLLGNTMYGASASQFNKMGNVVYSNRITANVRAVITSIERWCNAIQTTTDSVHFDLLQVYQPHHKRNLMLYTFPYDNRMVKKEPLKCGDSDVGATALQHTLNCIDFGPLSNIVKQHNLEAKDRAESLTYKGKADRKHGNTYKMRGYKQTDTHYIDDDSTKPYPQRIMDCIESDPHHVPVSKPLIIPHIVSIGDMQQHSALLQANRITVGDVVNKVRIPTLFAAGQYIYRTIKQRDDMLKFLGSIEKKRLWSVDWLFYDVESQTIDFATMCQKMHALIRENENTIPTLKKWFDQKYETTPGEYEIDDETNCSRRSSEYFKFVQAHPYKSLLDVSKRSMITL